MPHFLVYKLIVDSTRCEYLTLVSSQNDQFFCSVGIETFVSKRGKEGCRVFNGCAHDDPDRLFHRGTPAATMGQHNSLLDSMVSSSNCNLAPTTRVHTDSAVDKEEIERLRRRFLKLDRDGSGI